MFSRYPLFVTACQVLFLMALWLLADRLVRAWALPIPAGVLGLALLAALLFSRLLPVAAVQRGADRLLADMLLFFVPPLMAIVDSGPLLRQLGWRLLLVLPLGCILVMVGTGLIVDRVFRYEQRRHQDGERSDDA
ncbi:CidA/LrgA family protein [Chitinimonas sp.]|uniref:CidA/LrgA family protein n=1 Tax=Chitinimonas sp. TaxID=1934313 RepID=UPI0035B3DCB5